MKLKYIISKNKDDKYSDKILTIEKAKDRIFFILFAYCSMMNKPQIF